MADRRAAFNETITWGFRVAIPGAMMPFGFITGRFVPISSFAFQEPVLRHCVGYITTASSFMSAGMAMFGMPFTLTMNYQLATCFERGGAPGVIYRCVLTQACGTIGGTPYYRAYVIEDPPAA